jgi:hypothetical protein
MMGERGGHGEHGEQGEQGDEQDPREHGLIFGRGDELPAGTEEPPARHSFLEALYGPASSPGAIAFADPPAEEVTLVGDIPWELQDGTDPSPDSQEST